MAGTLYKFPKQVAGAQILGLSSTVFLAHIRKLDGKPSSLDTNWYPYGMPMLEVAPVLAQHLRFMKGPWNHRLVMAWHSCLVCLGFRVTCFVLGAETPMASHVS